MWFPKYWSKGRSAGHDVRGRSIEIACWGYSDLSTDEARRSGSQRAARLISRLGSGDALDHYGYPDRPAREEIVQELEAGQAGGEFRAVVSRNGYGCEVLNTQSLMFVDIDLPNEDSGWLSRLLGSRKRAARMEKENLEHIRGWSAQHPERALRVYRTRAGFRLLAADRPAEPLDEKVHGMMKELRVDPLYARFPFEDVQASERFRTWQKNYESAAQRYATCRFVEALGSAPTLPEFRACGEFHDRITQADSAFRLA